MSQTAITLAFEQHLAELQLGGQPVVPDEFVLAYIPRLDLTAPIDRAAGLPPAGQIVHRQPVDQRGKVNANGVAYSIIMDTQVGDFTFNAMYLVHKASGMVAMVVHKADEDKLKNLTNRPGNSLVKSMLMEYQGAAETTNTSVDANTWQIDFTARLMGLDEDIRLQAWDHYGATAFIADGFAVTPGQGVNEFLVAPGLGYIAGLRALLASQQSVVVSQRPATLYADVYHAGTLLSDWHTHVEIKASSTPLTDYMDGAGYPHYVVPIASLAANGAVTDLRGRGGLWWHENRPLAHTKDQVGLNYVENWSWTHSYTDPTGGATKYATGKAVADAYNALNSGKLNKAGGMMTGPIHRDITGTGGEFRHLTTPKGAYLVSGSGAVGAIKIVLPALGNNTMMRLRVSLYEYDARETTDILITGYNYSVGWQRVGALILGEQIGRDFPVRFGRNATHDLIYIGNLDSVWSYPKIHVAECSLTHSGSDQPVWDEPWAIELETVAFEGVTETLSDNLPAANWLKLKNFPGVGVDAGNLMEVGAGGLLGAGPTTSAAGYPADLNEIYDKSHLCLTLNGSFDGTPHGDAITLTGQMRVTRRGLDTGAAVVQEIWLGDGTYWWRMAAGFTEGKPNWLGWVENTGSKMNLGGGVDLNTITRPGKYGQPRNVDAASGSNYPEPYAGTLEVGIAKAETGSAIISQKYIIYNTGNEYTRVCYNASWTLWRRTVTHDEANKTLVGLPNLQNWSYSHSYTDPTGGATKYATGKAVADAYNALNSAKLNAASYTAADVLAKLLTVHGAGSMLDADSVDGIEGAKIQRNDERLFAHYGIYTKDLSTSRHIMLRNIGLWSTNSGSVTGIFAIKLGGIGNNTFFNGRIVIARNYNLPVEVEFNGYAQADGDWSSPKARTTDSDFVKAVKFAHDADGSPTLLLINNLGTPGSSVWSNYPQVFIDYLNVGWTGAETNEVRSPGNYRTTLLSDEAGYSISATVTPVTVWSSENHGANSGMDAGLFEGKNGSHYLEWANFTGKPATATRWPNWSEVTDKPELFTPSGEAFADGSGWAVIGSITTPEGEKPLIKQWGITASGFDSEVYYPIAFSTALCSFVGASLNDDNGAGETFAVSEINGGNGSLPGLSSARVVKYLGGNTSAQRVYWEATGY